MLAVHRLPLIKASHLILYYGSRPNVPGWHRLAAKLTNWRTLATVPSHGPDLQLFGQCSVDAGKENENPPRRVSLAPSMRSSESSADELRQEFLRFFQSNHHPVVSAASVYPKLDEGSYFVNAGMNQFKPLFLATSPREQSSTEFGRLKRATTAQPCIRLGGRMDDLNDVGYDRQHHTMFEMLGNWSFGDYYKAEACRLMWTFVTKVLGIPTNALYVTYFGGCPELGLPADDETRDIWLNLGVLDQKLMPFGVKQNFWRAGQSSGAGLCGPATELHVDFNALSGLEGLRCARCLINTPSPLVVELWNSVFITHRLRESATNGNDGSDMLHADRLEPLGRCFVDTGMGLERLACVMQGVTSTYDTDLFLPLLQFIHTRASSSSRTAPEYSGEFLSSRVTDAVHFDDTQISNTSPDAGNALGTADSQNPLRTLRSLLRRLVASRFDSKPSCFPTTSACSSRLSFDPADSPTPSDEWLRQWHVDVAYRLLADHSRALAHALADGVLPGRQGLGLKLRQLIQRATRAAVLTNLDEGGEIEGTRASNSVRQRQSLLASLVAEVASRERLAEGSTTPSLQGPNARQPSRLSYSEMSALVDQEVRAFLPRMHEMEKAFAQCLNSHPETHQLSGKSSFIHSLILILSPADQVRDLIDGRYGAPVSWDMICAQSQWAGLTIPTRPTSPSANPPDAPSPGGQSRSSSGTSSNSSSLQRQFLASQIPPTNDSFKYHIDRCTDQFANAPPYVIPSCHSRLLGLVIANQDRGTHTLVTWPRDSTPSDKKILPSGTDGATEIGFLVEETNFFSPAGGQDCDTGTIRVGTETYPVTRVEKVTDGTNDSLGWVIHWSTLPSSLNSIGALTHSELDSAHSIELIVDQSRRRKLMRHHTGQHLFVSALNAVASESMATVQLHLGSVHADRFVVNAAMTQPQNLDTAEDAENVTWLLKLLQRVEETCRATIEKHLLVTRTMLNWSAVAQDSKIRRFPWITYPDQVTAVRIGQSSSPSTLTGSVPTSEAAAAATSHTLGGSDAELCCGTHVENTGDLMDLVVVSARGRRQTMKQFIVVVGESARAIRLRGESLLTEAHEREARQSCLSDNIAWLESVLHQSPDASSLLPLQAREDLQACLHRMRTRRMTSPGALPGDDNAQDLNQLQTLLYTAVREENPCVFASAGDSRVDSEKGSTALNLAHSIANALSDLLPSVKARPLRSNQLTATNRHCFASLQLIDSAESSTSSWDALDLDTVNHLVGSVLSEPAACLQRP